MTTLLLGPLGHPSPEAKFKRPREVPKRKLFVVTFVSGFRSFSSEVTCTRDDHLRYRACGKHQVGMRLTKNGVGGAGAPAQYIRSVRSKLKQSRQA
jgi:hypothetical protein